MVWFAEYTTTNARRPARLSIKPQRLNILITVEPTSRQRRSLRRLRRPSVQLHYGKKSQFVFAVRARAREPDRQQPAARKCVLSRLQILMYTARRARGSNRRANVARHPTTANYLPNDAHTEAFLLIFFLLPQPASQHCVCVYVRVRTLYADACRCVWCGS